MELHHAWRDRAELWWWCSPCATQPAVATGTEPVAHEVWRSIAETVPSRGRESGDLSLVHQGP